MVPPLVMGDGVLARGERRHPYGGDIGAVMLCYASGHLETTLTVQGTFGSGSIAIVTVERLGNHRA